MLAQQLYYKRKLYNKLEKQTDLISKLNNRNMNKTDLYP